MGYLEENQQTGRVILPDLVRAFALIGIAVVNVGVFAYPMMGGFMEGGLEMTIDQVVFFTVLSFFMLKSYTLFSFMFGVGFAYQITSAEKRQASFGGRYFRRIIGLLALGIMHVLLLFQGDILFMYGLLGTILFFFRKLKAKTLRIIAICVYAVQILMVGLFALGSWAGQKYAPEEFEKEAQKMMEAKDRAIDAYGSGSFADTMAVRWSEFGELITFGTLMQGFGVFAFFLFGLAAVKSNVINDPDNPIWARFRKIFLPIGIIGSMIGAYVLVTAPEIMSPRMMVGMFILTIFSPFSTAGYLGLIAKWSQGEMTPLKVFMARGGTATLTAYLMQSLLLSLIFNAYGLGLYMQFGAAGSIALGFIVALFSVSFSSFWRKKFKRGPMEVLLRRWTYLGTNA